MVELGIHDNILNEDYHRGRGISKTGLDRIDRSPLHFITEKEHPKPPTPTLFIGKALHALVLEPDEFDKEFMLQPKDAPKRPTAAQLSAAKPSAKTLESIAYWKAFDKDNEGKTVITNTPGDNAFWSPGDWDRIHYMAESVAQHPTASVLLNPSDGKPERTCYWIDHDTGELCKCRPDFDNQAHNMCVDLKSTSDASYSEFARSIAKWRYHVQHAFYMDGLREADQARSVFVFVAVESSPPYAVACYTLPQEAVRAGRIAYQRNLEVYSQCRKLKEWPGYEDLRDIELSRWQMASPVR